MRGHPWDGKSVIPRRIFCYLPPEMLAELKAQAVRLERSPSYVAQLAWRIAKRRMERLSSLTELRRRTG